MIFSQMVLFVIQGVKFKHFYGHLQISALELELELELIQQMPLFSVPLGLWTLNLAE